MFYRVLAMVSAMAAAAVMIGAGTEDTPIVIGDGSFFVESPKMKFACWEKSRDPEDLGHGDKGGSVRNVKITKGEAVEFDGACERKDCRMLVDFANGKAKVRVQPRFNDGTGFLLKFVKPGKGSWKSTNTYRRDFDEAGPYDRITSVAFAGREFCTAAEGRCRIELSFTPEKAIPEKCQ